MFKPFVKLSPLGSAAVLVFALVIVAAVVPVLSGSNALAAVHLNELTPQGDEWVELFNKSLAPEDISGWEIEGGLGTYVVPPGTIIPPGDYFLIDLPGDYLVNGGGETALIDDFGTIQSVVYYGRNGSAPLPWPPPPPLAMIPPTVSLARAPDAADFNPPPGNPATDGLVWTIDPTATWGAHNDAPNPAPGMGIAVLNELDPKQPNGFDRIELFNSTVLPANLFNWWITNGNDVFFFNTFVPPLGVGLIQTPLQFNLEHWGLVYLFDGDGVRVDQLAFWDAPPLDPTQCFARCPDGTHPYLGYDFPSSGGFIGFNQAPCTLGALNNGAFDCALVSVDPPPQGALVARLSAQPSVLGSGACRLSWTGPVRERPTGVTILSAQGRVVREIGGSAERDPGAGVRWVWIWDGLDAAGRRVPSGLYFARSGPAGSATARIVVLR